MSLNTNLPATKTLNEMISLAIHLDKLCELAHFTLRYIERNKSKKLLFVEDPQKLKQLLNELEAMRDLMPSGACDLSSRTQDSTYNAMFENDVENIYNTLTKQAAPEAIVGRSKTNMDKFNKLAHSLKEELQKTIQQGPEVVAETVGQLLWQQGQEGFNAITKSTIFTYQNELEALQLQIKSILDSKDPNKKTASSEKIKTIQFQEKPMTQKQLAHQLIIDVFNDMQDKFNGALHPAVAFEMLKKCIVTFEVHDELRHTPPGAKAIEGMLLFLKSQCGPEEFKKHLAGINTAVNTEINERIKKGEKLIPGEYKIEAKYSDILKSEKRQSSSRK